jgi:hypothetical protein
MITRRRTHIRWLAAACIACFAGTATWAQDDTLTQRVRLKKDTSSATINGTIKGYQTMDYIVAARKGQNAKVSLTTRAKATYFNILAPGQTKEAFFNGSVSQNQYEGVLPEDGDYRIRVYMVRADARRNESASYRLEIATGSTP